jgi:hypothetical protein
MYFSIPQDLKLFLEHVPSVLNKYAIVNISYEYLQTTDIQKAFPYTLKMIRMMEYEKYQYIPTRVDRNQFSIQLDLGDLYSDDVNITIRNIIELLLPLAKGDLSVIDEEWHIERSSRFIFNPVIKSIGISLECSDGIYATDPQKILSHFSDYDKLIILGPG